MQITIPGIFPDLNKIIAAAKRHWSEYARFKRTYSDLVVATVKNNYEPITDYPVILRFNWYCKNRKIDPDNIAAAKKMVIDGLVTAGILTNDGWTQIAGLSDSFYVDKANPRVVMHIVTEEANCKDCPSRL